jgi:hypothetical protein
MKYPPMAVSLKTSVNPPSFFKCIISHQVKKCTRR